MGTKCNLLVPGQRIETDGRNVWRDADSRGEPTNGERTHGTGEAEEEPPIRRRERAATRRYRIRAGRRDDDKRKTKGRRHPPGYIPGAL